MIQTSPPYYIQAPRRPWWSHILAIPGYAAGWIGDHFINVLVLLFAVLLMANLTPPL